MKTCDQYIRFAFITGVTKFSKISIFSDLNNLRDISRADCVVVTPNSVYIFEFKLSGNGSAENALNQIKEKHYVEKYRMDGKKIVLIGAGFDEEKRTVKEWKVELS